MKYTSRHLNCGGHNIELKSRMSKRLYQRILIDTENASGSEDLQIQRLNSKLVLT
jgi:hypothetical protein